MSSNKPLLKESLYQDPRMKQVEVWLNGRLGETN